MIGTRAALVVLALAAAPASAADYAWPVVKVVDGDTVKVDAASDMPPELASIVVRLRGVDTPEKGGRATCSKEREAGQRATAFTTDAIAAAKEIVVRDPAWDVYAGDEPETRAGETEDAGCRAHP